MDNIVLNISIWDTVETVYDKVSQFPIFNYGPVINYQVSNIKSNYGARGTRLAGELTSVDITFIPTSGSV